MAHDRERTTESARRRAHEVAHDEERTTQSMGANARSPPIEKKISCVVIRRPPRRSADHTTVSGILEEGPAFGPARDHSSFDSLAATHPDQGAAGCLHSHNDTTMWWRKKKGVTCHALYTRPPPVFFPCFRRVWLSGAGLNIDIVYRAGRPRPITQTKITSSHRPEASTITLACDPSDG